MGTGETPPYTRCSSLPKAIHSHVPGEAQIFSRRAGPKSQRAAAVSGRSIRMRRCITVVFAALASVPIGAATDEPKYDVCRTQLIDYVESRFQSRVTRIDFRFDYDDRSFPKQRALPLSGSQALVYTNGCRGYHVVDLDGSHFDCVLRAHYETPRNYLHYRSSHGQCGRVGGG